MRWRSRSAWTHDHPPRGRRFAAGVLAGIALLLGGRFLINHTTLADRLVAPLLRSDTSASADLIVVPGAGVIGDCVPNANGVRRVVRAARALREGRAPAMLILGGTGDDACPVSVAMARFAEEIGVPADRIMVEPTSRSTRENAERATPLLDALGARRLLLVTDRLHMPRAEGAFLHYGFQVERASVPIYEGHPDNVDMLKAGFREGLAIAYYRFRGWLAPAAAPRQTARAVLPGQGWPSSAVSHPDGPVVVIGASYAAGWTPGPLAGRGVVNKGVAGEQSFEMLERFERDVVPEAPRAVIIWGFINDVFRSPVGDNATALAGVRDAYSRMVGLARARGIEPVLATEVTIRPPQSWLETPMQGVGRLLGRRAYQDLINTDVAAVNQWLTEMAAREGLLVLDFNAVLSDARGWRSRAFAQPDGSHITAAGYEAITAYARPVLERHLAGSPGSHADRARD